MHLKIFGRKMFVSTRFYPNIFRLDKYLASYRRDVPKIRIGLYVVLVRL